MALQIFISYAHEDEAFMQEFVKHLSSLKHRKLVDAWHDRKIKIGERWGDAISENLEGAHIIIPLISADFLFSEYCTDIEMTRAVERETAGDAIIAPVMVRAVNIKGTPFDRMQVFPKDLKAVKSWNDPDAAWVQVVSALEAVCEDMMRRVFTDDDVVEGETMELNSSSADIDRIKSMAHVVDTAGPQGAAMPGNQEHLKEDLDEILQKRKSLEELQDATVKEIKVGNNSIATIEVLLKKAMLLRNEADQMFRDSMDGHKEMNEAHYIIKLSEAHKLLLEANALDPTDTGVLLEMAKVLINLTPDDPRDEEELLMKIVTLLDNPKDEQETFRLAHAIFLIGTSRHPYSEEQILRARGLFEKLGRTDWTSQCDYIIEKYCREEEGYEEAPVEFNPIGDWYVNLGDAVGSVMYLSIYEQGNFIAGQEAEGVRITAQGTWSFTPATNTVFLQGTLENMQPFVLTFAVGGFEENIYIAMGSDGCAYFMQRMT